LFGKYGLLSNANVAVAKYKSLTTSEFLQYSIKF
jgi:hypothetical protein